MPTWPRGAELSLDAFVMELHQVGLVEMLEQTVSEVWRVNVNRHDPHRYGDTPRSLGVLSSENVRERILRVCGAAETSWMSRGVRSFTSDTSLIIAYGGVEIRVKKARQAPNRIPDWHQFDWRNDSTGRREAAMRNTDRFQSAKELEEQLVLIDYGGSAPTGEPLQDALLVWSGDGASGLTAGWLGYPYIGTEPWLAIKRLWWHEGNANPAPSSADNPAPPSMAPTSLVRLKTVNRTGAD